MNAILKHIIKFTLLLFLALCINAEKRDCVFESVEMHIFNYCHQEDSFTAEFGELNIESSLPALFRANTGSVSWIFPNAYRKLFLVKALLFERYFIVHKIAMQVSNLAIVTQPQTDYYLYTLNCMRI